MKHAKKNILIISLPFAPNAKVGSRRFGYLSKIFHEYHFNCHILTVKKKYLLLQDSSVPFGGIIHRTGLFPPITLPPKKDNLIQRKFYRLWSRLTCLPDPYAGWIIPAFTRGLSIIIKNSIHIIIVTGPPFSPMITGYLLSKVTGAKLILDYRDPWTTNPSDQNEQKLKEKINRRIEKTVVNQASAIVFCSKIMKNEFQSVFKKQELNNTKVITNAFNPEHKPKALKLGDGAKVMLYAGHFYGERKLEPVLDSLWHLVSQNRITTDNFKIYVFGWLSEQARKIAEAKNLSDMIIESPPVDYQTILRYMKGADFLFLPSGGDVKYAIPFKFFDYLSVRKPMLVVAPPDSAIRDLMTDIDCGYYADMYEQQSITQALGEMIQGTSPPTFSGADEYTWPIIANKYKDLIHLLQ